MNAPLHPPARTHLGMEPPVSTALDDVLSYRAPAVLADIEAHYAIDHAQARLLFEQALRFCWLLSRHPSPGDTVALLARPLAAIAAVGERFVLNTRAYVEFCERYFGRFIHWPRPEPGASAPSQARLNTLVEWIYDQLGPQVFALWFQQLAERYPPEHLQALRTTPSHKTLNVIAAPRASRGLSRAPGSQVEVHCAVSGQPARAARVAVTLHEPRVIVVDDAFTPAECDALTRRAVGRTRTSRVRDQQSDPSRTSETWRPPADDRLVVALRNRIAALVDMPPSTAEPLKVHRYGPGARFDLHHDNPSREVLQHQGVTAVRLVSCIIYLGEVEQGGDTWFPHLGLSVCPRPGTMLAFHNFDRRGHEDPTKRHAGRTVHHGNKWIATQWWWSTPYAHRSQGRPLGE
ncbi:MAG: 2OG-Fe(II) oxygenase [Deltaproteobacteria bacterium]|nr:2OG-Fe(II) oxygenase [Deltaproteobacteria bacterium]